MSAAIVTNQPVPVAPGSRFRIGAWVVIASVTMLFTGLSSAGIVVASVLLAVKTRAGRARQRTNGAG